MLLTTLGIFPSCKFLVSLKCMKLKLEVNFCEKKGSSNTGLPLDVTWFFPVPGLYLVSYHVCFSCFSPANNH